MEDEKNKKYIILGKTYTSKPLKLQLNKNSYNYLRKLSQYIKDKTELTEKEMKDPEFSFMISLAITGFLSNEEQCIESLSLFVEEEEDWKNVISKNKEKFDDIKTVTMNILNDFFLNVLILTKGSGH